MGRRIGRPPRNQQCAGLRLDGVGHAAVRALPRCRVPPRHAINGKGSPFRHGPITGKRLVGRHAIGLRHGSIRSMQFQREHPAGIKARYTKAPPAWPSAPGIASRHDPQRLGVVIHLQNSNRGTFKVRLHRQAAGQRATERYRDRHQRGAAESWHAAHPRHHGAGWQCPHSAKVRPCRRRGFISDRRASPVRDPPP